VWDECTAAEAGLVDDPLHKDEADIVDLDMLPEDMPAFDIRSGDPLFIGDTSEHGIQVGEAVYYFMQLRIAQGWSRPSFDRFLKVQVMLMGGPTRCRLPTSLYKMRTYMRVQDHMAHAVHVCPKWCRHFPRESDSTKWNTAEECGTVLEKDEAGNVLKRCTERRFEAVETANGTKWRPREWFYYFPVEETIRKWMECPEFCKARARRDARLQHDFWTSNLAQAINRHPSINGALLQDAPTIQTPEGGDPGVEYVLWDSMGVGVGADDAQVFNSDTR